MARSQFHRTPKRNCDRCGEESRATEKVSKRILAPSGGHLCLDCLVPAALEANRNPTCPTSLTGHPSGCRCR